MNNACEEKKKKSEEWGWSVEFEMPPAEQNDRIQSNLKTEIREIIRIDERYLNLGTVSDVNGNLVEAAIFVAKEVENDAVLNGINKLRPFFGFLSIEVDESNTEFASINGVLFNKEITTLVHYPEEKKSTNYIIPSSVTSISDSAFLNCSLLTSVSIPSSVTTIGSYAFHSCNGLTTIYYGGSTNISSSNVFEGCGALTNVCVPPDYNSTTFCGVDVTPDSDICKSFSDMFNHCYEASFTVNGMLIQMKRKNATEWEQQSDGCLEYQCHNESGKLSWSLCNSTDTVSYICVNNKCEENKTAEINERWSVEIEVSSTQPNDVNINELKVSVSQMTGIDEDKLEIGLVSDSNGNIIRVIVYVKDGAQAKELAEAVESIDKDEGCSYGILCRTKALHINKVLEQKSISVISGGYQIISSIYILASLLLLMVMM